MKKLYEESSVQAIADAIRAKAGTADTYKIAEMPDAIARLPSGGGATEPYIEETYDSEGNLIDVKMHGYTKIRDGMFSGLSLSNIILPTELVSIGNFSFSGCENLSLNSLPAGVTSIGDYAFDICYSLSLTNLPDGIDRIGSAAFNMCKGLTELTFMGTPTSIASSAFEGCTNLTTINVPWAEGAVDNAPWGATNATINYNYTGG